MKTLLAFLTAITLSTNGIILVVSCNNGNKIEEKTQLDKVIMNKNLNKLDNSNEQTVKTALASVNPGLKTEEIDLKAITKDDADAIVETKYHVVVMLNKIQKFMQVKFQALHSTLRKKFKTI